MKMFLTRMGMNSKIIVTGDLTQTDLPPTLKSGLNDAVHRLRGIPRLAIVQLDESDIVRHALVQQIVKAYEEGGTSGGKADYSPQKDTERHKEDYKDKIGFDCYGLLRVLCVLCGEFPVVNPSC